MTLLKEPLSIQQPLNYEHHAPNGAYAKDPK